MKEWEQQRQGSYQNLSAQQSKNHDNGGNKRKLPIGCEWVD